MPIEGAFLSALNYNLPCRVPMREKPLPNFPTRVLFTLTVLFLFPLFPACEKPAEIENPQQYKKDGISFTHPGNWSVTEDLEEDGYRYVIVETPGDALFMVQVYEEYEALDLESFVESYSEQVKTDTPVGSAGESSRSPIERRIQGDLLTGTYERFDVRMMGIRVPHIIEYYRLESGDKVYFLITFVSDEDLELVTKGFDQILGSFAVEKSSEPEDEAGQEAASSEVPEASEPDKPKRPLRHEKMK